MRINFARLRDSKVPADVDTWMKAHGTNHLYLAEGLANAPELRDDIEWIGWCLASAMQKKRSHVVARRLYAAYRKLRFKAELEALERSFDKTPECLL